MLLKRGMAASIDELLAAAEYILAEGNPNVILCERGIRTFETATRNTLDLSAIPVLRERTHLPVLVDPSHAVGVRRWIAPLCRAAKAVGAHGLLIEVHPNPAEAKCDADQALTFARLPPHHDRAGRSSRSVGTGRSQPLARTRAACRGLQSGAPAPRLQEERSLGASSISGPSPSAALIAVPSIALAAAVDRGHGRRCRGGLWVYGRRVVVPCQQLPLPFCQPLWFRCCRSTGRPLPDAPLPGLPLP